METIKEYYLYVKLPKDSINVTTLESSTVDTRTYYYLKLFSDFKNALRGKIKWNWYSAFFGMQWLAYRKMYYFAMLFIIFYSLIGLITEVLLGAVFKNLSSKAIYNFSVIMTYIMSFFIMGLYGNRLYYNSICSKIKKNISPAKKNVSIFAIFTSMLLPIICGICVAVITKIFLS